MTLLFMDGFEHYGSDTSGVSAMLEGPYIRVPETMPGWEADVSSASARTGSRAIRFPRRLPFPPTPGSRVFLHALRSGAQETVGASISWLVTEMPNTGAVELLSFRNANAAAQLTITQSATGQIAVVRGYARNGSGAYPSGVELAITPGPVLYAGSYNHLEARVRCHDADGSVEVRVDGVTVLSVSGVDTQNISSPGGIASVGFGPSNVSSPSQFAVPLMYVDDFYVWDSTGDSNNDFVGIRGVHTLLPDGDSLPQDWESTGLNGWSVIAKTAPNDASYIYEDDGAASPPAESRFTIASLPDGVGAISAIMTSVRQLKTDSGPANTQVSLVSDGEYAEGVDRPITTASTYWSDVFEVDPSTGAPWTKEAVDLAELSIRRTS